MTAAVTIRATSTTTPGPDSTAPSHDTATTCSFDRPPTTSGTPASESSPNRNDTRSSGVARALPRRALAAVPPAAIAAQPIARKSSALKMACDHRWNRPASGPASGGAAASADSMTPTWLTVDHASSRLRSLCANASTAASSMVSDTAMPSTQRGVWLTDEQREEAGQHHGAGGDHGRGVDERAGGGGALHGVGEPVLERDLRRLAEHADDDERQEDRAQRAVGRVAGREGLADRGARRGQAVDAGGGAGPGGDDELQVRAVGPGGQADDAEHEPDVGDAA